MALFPCILPGLFLHTEHFASDIFVNADFTAYSSGKSYLYCANDQFWCKGTFLSHYLPLEEVYKNLSQYVEFYRAFFCNLSDIKLYDLFLLLLQMYIYLLFNLFIDVTYHLTESILLGSLIKNKELE